MLDILLLQLAILAEIRIKCVIFIEKLQKSPSAGGFAPRTLCLRWLGALTPNYQPQAAGDRTTMSYGGWGISLQTSTKPSPIFENF